MPIKHSAVRDLRVSHKRASANLKVRENLRFLLRRCRQQFAAKDAAKATAAVAAAVSAFDRAARAGIVKAGHAARHKSRLMLRLNRLGR
ncbi:MAG: 30S ribosomal protein S20 [bacterium]|nr:30S ribosomal protein S20 [bacterium]